ncbi:porin [Ramlibacter sp. G-1-2-2]|uniref:Porin n=1 Tax=Ramlibacter agri TaxID=2728837 RepID=A0A848GZS3_9BURK|nr:porin [Ramlibacter agri]NML42881.1 porin [Ramlibacter agri]
MSKRIAGLVLLACAGAANAQIAGTGAGIVTSSNVTLFGVVDVAAAWGGGSIADRTRLVSGANSSSRVGFRGVEDLGAHLGAGFWLEAGVNADDGTGATSNTNNQPVSGSGSGGLTFNRRSTVSLMGDWGELRLGRDIVASWRNKDQTDPFSTNGVGTTLPHAITIAGVTAQRASNMIGYFLPQALLPGVFGEAQYYAGENQSGSDGNGWQARLGYANKTWGLAAGYGLTKYAQTATLGDTQVWNVGAHWDFGVARLTAGYFHDTVKQVAERTGTGYIVGAVAPIGAGQLKLSYSTYKVDDLGDPTARKLALGYVYNLSQRTALYATYAHIDNRGPSDAALNGALTAPGSSSNGVDLGLKHSF